LARKLRDPDQHLVDLAHPAAVESAIGKKQEIAPIATLEPGPTRTT
jgi:hypothetical protein